MILNYDFSERAGDWQSTVDVLSGTYNKNPFLFEQKLVHTMGVETYHGYRTISWTETYRGSDGKTHTRTRTQTLHASGNRFYHPENPDPTIFISRTPAGAENITLAEWQADFEMDEGSTLAAPDGFVIDYENRRLIFDN